MMIAAVIDFLRRIGPLRAVGLLVMVALLIQTVAVSGYLLLFDENFRVQHLPLMLILLWVLVPAVLIPQILLIGAPVYRIGARRSRHSALVYALIGGLLLWIARAVAIAFWNYSLFTPLFWGEVLRAALNPWHLLTVLLGAGAGYLFGLSVNHEPSVGIDAA